MPLIEIMESSFGLWMRPDRQGSADPLTVQHYTDTLRKYNSYFLEADQLTGPWRIICHTEGFGEQACFITCPRRKARPP